MMKVEMKAQGLEVDLLFLSQSPYVLFRLLFIICLFFRIILRAHSIQIYCFRSFCCLSRLYIGLISYFVYVLHQIPKIANSFAIKHNKRLGSMSCILLLFVLSSTQLQSDEMITGEYYC